MLDKSVAIRPEDFRDRFDRRVLADDGSQGVDGVPRMGSTTERLLGNIAAALYGSREMLDAKQFDELDAWIQMYRQRL